MEAILLIKVSVLFVLCTISDICVQCVCVYESSEASAYSFGLATNPNPTRARSYPLNINPKPDPIPESISGPAASGRVADLYPEGGTEPSSPDWSDSPSDVAIDIRSSGGAPKDTSGTPPSMGWAGPFPRQLHW